MKSLQLSLILQKKAILMQYELTLHEDDFFNSHVEKDLQKFKTECYVIIANRNAEELADVVDKIYTRDLMGRD